MNYNGKGVPRNLDESYHWFREAAKSGNENARKALKSTRALEKIRMNTEDREIPEFDIIINATSLGLNNETIDLNTSNIGDGKLFYDVIYNPNETNFLKDGKKLGNQTENGKLMFIYQAFEAFKLWHKVQPEINEDLKNFLDI